MIGVTQLRKPNAMPTFADFIESERARINAELERLRMERSKIGDAMYVLEKELSAVAAYENAKLNKPASGGPVRRGRGTGNRRDEIMRAIGASPTGLSRGELLSKLGLKGDRAGEMSVSNILTGLTRTGALVRADHRYRVQ